MSDVKVLIESIIDDHAELHIYQDEGYVKNSDVLAEKIVAALEASVRAPESADYLFENPEPVAVPPEFFERLAQVTEAPEPVQAPAVDQTMFVHLVESWQKMPFDAGDLFHMMEGAGILQDAAEVEARALEAFADNTDEFYPPDVFPAPDEEQYGHLRVALARANLTLDRFSADLMRRAAGMARARAQQVREGKA